MENKMDKTEEPISIEFLFQLRKEDDRLDNEIRVEQSAYEHNSDFYESEEFGRIMSNLPRAFVVGYMTLLNLTRDDIDRRRLRRIRRHVMREVRYAMTHEIAEEVESFKE